MFTVKSYFYILIDNFIKIFDAISYKYNTAIYYLIFTHDLWVMLVNYTFIDVTNNHINLYKNNNII